jgi:hypothetical protein
MPEKVQRNVILFTKYCRRQKDLGQGQERVLDDYKVRLVAWGIGEGCAQRVVRRLVTPRLT